MKNNRHGIRGVDHFSIPCSDAQRSLTFYEEIFGATVFRDELGEYVFGISPEDKALGRQVHIFVEIAGQRVELLGEDPGGKAPLGTHHAFSIGPNDVEVIQRHLQDHGIPYVGPATHRGTAAVSVYFLDPDGNELEFVCWDGYARLTEIPLLQHVAAVDKRYEWDPATRRARPKVAAST